nr:hypothetical protein CFP56_50779 [Quercus suber]
MPDPCSTPVSILILTLEHNLHGQVYARNNRAALISTLSSLAELPDLESLWYGVREMHGWKHDQLVFLIGKLCGV